jgi:hypothetical protein
MMTKELLLGEMARSEADEERTYRDLTLALFRGLQAPLKALYDKMASATSQLTSITPVAIQSTPKIIKILRYCLAPVISQMRLGQIIDLDSTEGFEEKGVRPTDEQADRLVRWFQDYLDRERFPWVANPTMPGSERGIAEHYAKLCTVSLLSNQNTATKYRNQRKERQEAAISEVLRGVGLSLQERLGAPPEPRRRRQRGDPPAPRAPRRLGGINAVDDVQPGHFVREKKILGGSEKKQKSDLTARPTAEERLVCIEAKAVGIRIDSTKRLKELNDKYTDWGKSRLPITTVGVVAGFFNTIELIATIQKRGIPIFFEHDLPRLGAFLQSGVYYDAPWDPTALFPDVPREEVEAALEKIRTAPVVAGESETGGGQPESAEE